MRALSACMYLCMYARAGGAVGKNKKKKKKKKKIYIYIYIFYVCELSRFITVFRVTWHGVYIYRIFFLSKSLVRKF